MQSLENRNIGLYPTTCAQKCSHVPLCSWNSLQSPEETFLGSQDPYGETAMCVSGLKWDKGVKLTPFLISLPHPSSLEDSQPSLLFFCVGPMTLEMIFSRVRKFWKNRRMQESSTFCAWSSEIYATVFCPPTPEMKMAVDTHAWSWAARTPMIVRSLSLAVKTLVNYCLIVPSLSGKTRSNFEYL